MKFHQGYTSGVGAVGALWYSDLEEKGSNSPHN